MIRIVLAVAVLLALYAAAQWLRDQEPAVQKRVGKWAIVVGLVALVAVPLVRLGLYWYAAAGSTAVVVLRRALPWAVRAWPIARKLWQRRRRRHDDDSA